MTFVMARRPIPSPEGRFNLVDEGATGIIIRQKGNMALVEFDDYGIPVIAWVDIEHLKEEYNG